MGISNIFLFINETNKLRYFEEFRINPDAATFNILLSTCRTLEEVDRVWGDMLHSGVKPNQISYTTKVDRLTQLGYPRYALQCFRELEKSGTDDFSS